MSATGKGTHREIKAGEQCPGTHLRHTSLGTWHDGQPTHGKLGIADGILHHTLEIVGLCQIVGGNRIIDDGHIMPVDGKEPVSECPHKPSFTQTGIYLLLSADTLFQTIGRIVVDDIVGLGDDVIQTAPTILDGSTLLILIHRSLRIILVGFGIGIEEIVGTCIAQIHEATFVEVIPGLGVETGCCGL